MLPFGVYAQPQAWEIGPLAGPSVGEAGALVVSRDFTDGIPALGVTAPRGVFQDVWDV